MFLPPFFDELLTQLVVILQMRVILQQMIFILFFTFWTRAEWWRYITMFPLFFPVLEPFPVLFMSEFFVLPFAFPAWFVSYSLWRRELIFSATSGRRKSSETKYQMFPFCSPLPSCFQK